MILTIGASIVVVSAVVAVATAGDPEIVSRSEWVARKPTERKLIVRPLDTVVIHHTYIPGACLNRTSCIQSMRQMQKFHMDDRGWADIGYNFAVGGDAVYEGRGWMVVGAHAPPYNNNSVGICMIGDYTEVLPTELMLKNARALIELGVQSGYIRQDYQLIGHRQARDTECPGDALYKEIQTWAHWTPNPVRPLPGAYDKDVVSLVLREEWGARQPTDSEPSTTPLNTVVIFQRCIEETCVGKDDCTQVIRSIQNDHMDNKKWSDIGYKNVIQNVCFMTCGDAVYEGRGWLVAGPTEISPNNRSFGISFIGNYTEKDPSSETIQNVLGLIKHSVTRGYLSPDYQLVDDYQSRNTDCSGDALHRLIQTWPHWTCANTTYK